RRQMDSRREGAGRHPGSRDSGRDAERGRRRSTPVPPVEPPGGARTAGIDCTHPDLIPNLDIQSSTSFVPGETACVTPGFYFNHGTHVAGIIAAAANGFGIVGVAPRAHIVAV